MEELILAKLKLNSARIKLKFGGGIKFKWAVLKHILSKVKMNLAFVKMNIAIIKFFSTSETLKLAKHVLNLATI